MNAPNKMTAIQSGTHEGIEWAIVAAPMPGGNGYVRIPDGHPWAGLGDDDIDVVAPGGLTYAGADGWVGFDTLHAGDYWSPEELDRLGYTGRRDYMPGDPSDPHHWTVEKLVEATKRLAVQIAAAPGRLAVSGAVRLGRDDDREYLLTAGEPPVLMTRRIGHLEWSEPITLNTTAEVSA